MKWTVSGADRDTGDEQSITIEADNEESARRRGNRAGLLVSTVERQPEEYDAPVAAAANEQPTNGPAEIAAALAALRPPPAAMPLAYTNTTPRRVPTYSGLSIASSVLLIYAMLLYIVGGIAIALGLFALTRAYGGPLGSGPDSIVVAFTVIGPGLALLFGGAIGHGASAALTALRDIAINSFR